MTVDKLPSGNYRVRLQINGKRYTKILDHEPKKSELERLFAGKIDLLESAPSVSLDVAYENYMSDKSKVFSPSTVRGYKCDYARLSPIIKVKKIGSINKTMLQREVNDMATRYSYKSIKNTITLVRAILKYYDVYTNLNVTLPQPKKVEPYIPSEEDIAKLLQIVKGTVYEIPCKLACYGLRLGEICALTLDDINGNKVTINKSQVYSQAEGWIIKAPKTTMSNRTIEISDELAELIRARGCIYDGEQGQLSKRLKVIQQRNGIPEFSMHKFRHYFCSKCIDLGIDFVTIQRLGGWSNLNTIQKVYAHRMREREKDSLVASEIGKVISV